MLNPAVELKAKKQQFISIRELIIRIASKFPDMTREQVANWIMIRLDEEGQYAPGLLIQDVRGITRLQTYSDPSFSSYELLGRVMVSPEMDDPLYDGWTPAMTINDKESIDFDSDIPF